MPLSSDPPDCDVDSKSVLDLVIGMMAVPGRSGEERQIAEFITDRLREAGIPASAISHDAVTRRSPFAGQIGNLIVRLPGTSRAPRRLLMAHIDTVPLCVGSRPVRKGKIITSADPHTGLGADDRAGAAVVLNAILEIRRRKLPHPPLTLFWPVQEEIGLFGARYASLSKLGNPRLCFNWDGGAPDCVTIGATGDCSIEIEIEGIASHAGGCPEQGVSAAAIAGLAITDLVESGWHGLVVKGKHAGTSNIGIVSGGEATNVVMPRLRLKAEARSHDPRFRGRIVEAYRKAFQRAATRVRSDSGKTGRIHFKSFPKYESFRLSPDEPCVVAAGNAVRAAGLEPEPRICNGGLDANWLSARGLPTVTLGCGQQDVHTVRESLHIDSFVAACRIGLLLATGVV